MSGTRSGSAWRAHHLRNLGQRHMRFCLGRLSSPIEPLKVGVGARGPRQRAGSSWSWWSSHSATPAAIRWTGSSTTPCTTSGNAVSRLPSTGSPRAGADRNRRQARERDNTPPSCAATHRFHYDAGPITDPAERPANVPDSARRCARTYRSRMRCRPGQCPPHQRHVQRHELYLRNQQAPRPAIGSGPGCRACSDASAMGARAMPAGCSGDRRQPSSSGSRAPGCCR